MCAQYAPGVHRMLRVSAEMQGLGAKQRESMMQWVGLYNLHVVCFTKGIPQLPPPPIPINIHLCFIAIQLQFDFERMAKENESLVDK